MSQQEASPDYWKATREQLYRRLRRKLRWEDRDVIEDLTQEALIRFLRCGRKQEVRHREGLLTRICERVAADFIRRRTRRRREVELGFERAERLPSDRAFHPEAGDPVERLCFLVLSHLEAEDPSGHRMVEAYLSGTSWVTLAEDTGTSYSAIRQRWSRCIRRLRSGFARTVSEASF